jgi:iron complex transport system permease protein
VAEVRVTARRRATPQAGPRPGLRLGVVLLVAVLAVAGILVWDIGPEPGSRGFRLIVEHRTVTVVTIVLVGICQATATVVFQTATSNRILTPSIMGFEAMYVLMQTSLVFVFGVESLAATDGVAKVLLQSGLMVVAATALYAWLFGGRRGDLHVTLLVGIVIGIGFGSLSVFMQRLLTPSEFDILAARLFGNISNSNQDYLPWAWAIVGVTLVLVWARRRRLDVLALGRDAATNLGLAYRREVLVLLVLTAVLISVSTTLVGPLTFLGFVVATLAYQLTGSTEHRHVLPFAAVLAVAMLAVGYFVLHHVFYSSGMLSVILELGGGLFFLIYLLRKGTL